MVLLLGERVIQGTAVKSGNSELPAGIINNQIQNNVLLVLEPAG